MENAIRFMFAWPYSCWSCSPGWGYAFLWHYLQAYRSLWLAYATSGRNGWRSAAALVALLLALNLPNAWTAVDDTRQGDLARPTQRSRRLGRWQLARQQIHHKLRPTTAPSTASWGGYAGETRFEYAGNPFSDTTIAEWRAQDVLFAIVPHFQYGLWREDGVHEFATQTTLLKSYSPSDAYRGPAMVVLLLQRIQHEATGRLGPIRLIGYELAAESVQPDESFPFHLYWQATAATEADYQVFNHLLDAEGRLVAQIDGPPLPDPLLRRSTMDWDDPEEIIYSREYTLSLPEDLPPGEYSIVTGFYRRDNGQRLLTPTGEDSLWVTSISVE